MARFKITWLETGVEEIVNQSDRDTVDGYIECRFGANFDPKKAKVEFVSDKGIAKAEPPKTNNSKTEIKITANQKSK